MIIQYWCEWEKGSSNQKAPSDAADTQIIETGDLVSLTLKTEN